MAGDYYVSEQDELITTVLGSCVSACIRDKKKGIGGINHFLLPDSSSEILSSSNRYGVFAMEQLINAIIKHGGERKNLEVKLVGGGNMLSGNNIEVGFNDIGQSNITFVKKFMATEGFAIAAQDLGGYFPRKIAYDVKTGKLLVNKLKQRNQRKYVAMELELQRKRNRSYAVDDDVELFD